MTSNQSYLRRASAPTWCGLLVLAQASGLGFLTDLRAAPRPGPLDHLATMDLDSCHLVTQSLSPLELKRWVEAGHFHGTKLLQNEQHRNKISPRGVRVKNGSG